MYLDASQDTGSIKINRPDLDPGDVPPDASCVLDIAERGEMTLEEVGQRMNLTRERVRQVEVRALIQLRRRSPL